MTDAMRQRCEQIVAYREQGMSDQDIAALMGLKTGTVRAYASALNLEAPKVFSRARNFSWQALSDWDAIHDWYVSYRRAHPKEAR